jgi:hypothetical protein
MLSAVRWPGVELAIYLHSTAFSKPKNTELIIAEEREKRARDPGKEE